MDPIALSAVLEDTKVSGLTHNFFPYPARTTPTIPREAITRLSPLGGIVLDPFCGGGTTLVESVALGRRAIGNDLNPLAVYISKVKTTRIDPWLIKEAFSCIRKELVDEGQNDGGLSPQGLLDANELKVLPESLVVNLLSIKKSIDRLDTTKEIADLLKLTLAATCFSLQDKRTLEKISFKHLFLQRLSNVLKGMTEFYQTTHSYCRTQILNDDAARIAEITSMPMVDLIVTSPPYPGLHVEYVELMLAGRVRSTLLAKLLNVELKKKNYLISGSEYFDKMHEVASAIKQVMRKNAYACIIVGFKQPQHERNFTEAFCSNGFRLVKTFSRRLEETCSSRRRWFPFLSKKSEKIDTERIFFFKT